MNTYVLPAHATAATRRALAHTVACPSCTWRRTGRRLVVHHLAKAHQLSHQTFDPGPGDPF